MTIKTLIVDDEPLAHDVVLSFINNLDDLEVVGQCYSATDALKFLSEQSIDLLILDIQMPMLTGIELLKVLRNRPHVIITSAYQEYALEGFELDVVDYLLKPFKLDRFIQAVAKVRDRLTVAESIVDKDDALKNKVSDADKVFVKVDRKVVQLSLNEVFCFEAYGNYVRIWRGEQQMLTPKTLTSFEQILNEDQFIRVHKSAIVNLAFIDYLEADELKLINGKSVPVGKQYRSKIKSLIKPL